jgi:hypothetical protein
VVWKRVVTRRAEGAEKERGRENRPNIHVFRLDLSLYIPATDPPEHGFQPNLSNPHTYTGVGLTVSARSVKPTHIHRRRFDRSGRKPTLYVQSRVPIISFPPIIQIPSPVFNHRPERGRRTFVRERERALRETERHGVLF